MAARPLGPAIATYTATYAPTWGRVTRTKHADDDARFVDWLTATGRPVTTDSLDLLTLSECPSLEERNSGCPPRSNRVDGFATFGAGRVVDQDVPARSGEAPEGRLEHQGLSCSGTSTRHIS